MKKGIAIFVIVLLAVFTCFLIVLKVNEKESNLTKIRLAEVTHSMFYAPLYVAIEEGYFEEEGIEIELILTPGADKVSAAVLSNDVEVGFAGTESSVYVYTGGESDYLQTFAGLTKRDGQFIVSKEPIDNFTMKDLVEKKVLVGRVGGMPYLSFEKAVVNEGVDTSKIEMDSSIEFAALSGSFIGGNGDFVNLFEPNATKLEKEGYGYVVASVGLLADEVPYTAFYSRKSYINDNKELLEGFTRAINKGLEFVNKNNSEKIANSIIDQFPDSSLNDVVTIVQRYKTSDSWLDNPFINEKSFDNLLEIMLSADQIDEKVPYKNLINNLHEK